VLPFREAMVVGDVGREPLQAAVKRAYNDVALKWIALEGPVALLCEITADSDRPFKPDDFDGVCHACDVLYSSTDLLARLADYLPRKVEMLAITETVLAALGRFRPHDPTLAPTPAQQDATHGTSDE